MSKITLLYNGVSQMKRKDGSLITDRNGVPMFTYIFYVKPDAVKALEAGNAKISNTIQADGTYHLSVTRNSSNAHFATGKKIGSNVEIPLDRISLQIDKNDASKHYLQINLTTKEEYQQLLLDKMLAQEDKIQHTIESAMLVKVAENQGISQENAVSLVVNERILLSGAKPVKRTPTPLPQEELDEE